MRVCMVLRKQFPHDIRVAKEASALQAAGHDVTLLCRGDDDRPTSETIDGIAIERVDTHRGRSTTARRRDSLRYYLSLVHPRWESALTTAVRDGVDAIHVHDLPLVPTGLAVGHEHDVPVVADLHENYPEAVRQWRRMYRPRDVLTNLPTLAWYAFLPIRRLKRIESRCVRDATATITVCQEARDHYVDDCGATPDDVTIVSNTVDTTRFDVDADPIPGFEDDFVLGYVGKYAPHRGLETILHGMHRLVDDHPALRLLIVGAPASDAYGARFRALVDDLGLTDHVTFTGWVDFDAVPSYMAACDVGLVPHADTPHTQTTVPHKLFQYMAIGLPVLVSDVRPLQRIVDETAAGLVFQADDPESAAMAIRRLYDDHGLAADLGNRGAAAATTSYNWARDADQLEELYRTL